MNLVSDDIPPGQPTTRGPVKKNAKVASNASEEILPVQEDAKTKLAEELSKIRVAESQEFTMPVKLEESNPIPQCRQFGVADLILPVRALTNLAALQTAREKGLCSVSFTQKDATLLHYIEKLTESLQLEFTLLQKDLCIKCFS